MPGMIQTSRRREGLGMAAVRSVCRSVAIVTAVLLTLHPSLAAQGVGSRPAGMPASAPLSEHDAFLKQYCVTCHNQRLRTQGLALDTLDLRQVVSNAVIWEKVIRKLRTGAMPPAGARRPEQKASDQLASWLETEIDRAAAARPNPGRTETWHRLNRAEYSNAVRDLLAIEIDVTALLPGDDGSYGFDNIAGVLKISPTQLDRYLSAGRAIASA